jgi:hypothetical protein
LVQLVQLVLNWYNLVAALAAGGVCNQQRSLAVGSTTGGHCHSCCARTCERVTIPPNQENRASRQLSPALPRAASKYTRSMKYCPRASTGQPAGPPAAVAAAADVCGIGGVPTTPTGSLVNAVVRLLPRCSSTDDIRPCMNGLHATQPCRKAGRHGTARHSIARGSTA